MQDEHFGEVNSYYQSDTCHVLHRGKIQRNWISKTQSRKVYFFADNILKINTKYRARLSFDVLP